jgi:predicted RNA-binding protein with PUA-like domain
MNYWLVKSEPETYSWDTFVDKGRDMWDGVRNYAARNHLRAMKLGDQVLFYHSNKGKEIIGIAKVVREHYPDPSSQDERWSVVDLEPLEKLPKTVTLEQIKQDESLSHMALLRQSRLSVQPVTPYAFDRILAMAYAEK